MRGWRIFSIACLSVLPIVATTAAAEPDIDGHAETVCGLIEQEAARNGLPAPFFARLVWTESRFDPGAVSPVGAEGIAQFMPGTARLRGLADSFDMKTALAASAKYLAEMRDRYGNLGRAAIGYNAGEERLRRWIGGDRWLPLETENYVLKVLNEPAERFADAGYDGTVAPLIADQTFLEGCRSLPVAFSRGPAVGTAAARPWLVQLAGGFQREAVQRQLQRLRQRHAMLGRHEVIFTRLRRPGARTRIHAAGIGADSRAEANRLCAELRRSGGSCIVQRNR